MWQRFTERTRKAVLFAQEEARALGDKYVDTEHMLVGLIQDKDNAACQILGNMNVSLGDIRTEVERLAKRRSGHPNEDMILTPSAKQAIDFAFGESRYLMIDRLGTEHLLLGIFRANGLGGKVLAGLGVSLNGLRAEVAKIQFPVGNPSSPEEIEKERARDAKSIKRRGRYEDEVWGRFTERARKTVFFAQEEAGLLGVNDVDTEHLLLGLVREDDSVAARLLQNMGVSLDRIRSEIDLKVTRANASTGQDMKLTPQAKRVAEVAYDEARNLQSKYIGTEHLLLGLIRAEEGLASTVLMSLGANLEIVRAEILRLQSGAAD